MRAALFALALLPSAALATIAISDPSTSGYWVEFQANSIRWAYSAGDPSPVDIIITNQNNQTLNGDFTIARYVPVSQESFTVTNVTLLVGTGYQVVFTDPSDHTNVYANSSDFEVKAPGTSPAPTTTSGSSGSSSGNSATSSGTASTTSPGSSSSSANKKNSALGMAMEIPGLLYASSAIVLGALFL